MFEPGWKKSVLGFVALGLVVLLVNLIVLVYASSRGNAFGVDSVVLSESTTKAQCATIQHTNTALHLLINVLSTTLLAGSNYCMQCLSAPTRPIIDRRHAQGRWLDIGVPSFRNLRSIPPLRLVLWCTLCLSSIPLHLLYNSLIFTSTSSNNYVVFSVSKSFVNSSYTSAEDYQVFDITDAMMDPEYGETVPIYNSSYQQQIQQYENISASDLLLDLHKNVSDGRLVNLTIPECIQAYTLPFQGLYRHVLLVSDPDTTRPPSLDSSSTSIPVYAFAAAYSYCIPDAGSWWPCNDNGTNVANSTTENNSDCGSGCRTPIDLNEFQGAHSATWAPLGPKVHYCLAQPTEPLCALRLQPTIAAAVVALNVVKTLAMILTLWIAFGAERPLLTIGDAISTFISEADPYTKGMCLADRGDFASCKEKKAGISAPRCLLDRKRKWFHSTSLRKWFLNVLLYLAGIGAIAGFLGRGLRYMAGPKDLASLWDLGFGTVSGRTMIKVLSAGDVGVGDVISYIILANISQLIFSFLYFSYNTIFTGMLAAREWDLFATKRRGLRVSSSHPVGRQNSNYFLQLPPSFGIPLIICSTIFHWLLSQSIFLVNIMIRDFNGVVVVAPNSEIEDGVETGTETFNNHLVTCGYSPIAMVFALILACLLVVAISCTAWTPLKTTMPVVGSCSAAIAAACHATNGNNDPTKELQWGVIDRLDSSKSFSSERNSLMTGESASMADDLLSPKMATSPRLTYRGLKAGGEMELHLLSVQTSTEDSERVGHCSFSSGPVEPAISGRYYA